MATAKKRTTKSKTSRRITKIVKPKNMPAVLMFQPTKFKMVPRTRLAQWERLLRTRVGLTGVHVGETGTCTECGCPNADDCDSD